MNKICIGLGDTARKLEETARGYSSILIGRGRICGQVFEGAECEAWAWWVMGCGAGSEAWAWWVMGYGAGCEAWAWWVMGYGAVYEAWAWWVMGCGQTTGTAAAVQNTCTTAAVQSACTPAAA